MQAVIVDFECDDITRIFPLQDKLEREINLKGVGLFDGNEFGEGTGTLYMYGPNADQLYEAVRPVIMSDPMRGAVVTIRYGEEVEAEQKKITLWKTPPGNLTPSTVLRTREGLLSELLEAGKVSSTSGRTLVKNVVAHDSGDPSLGVEVFEGSGGGDGLFLFGDIDEALTWAMTGKSRFP